MSEIENSSFGAAKHICIFLPSLTGGGAERVMVSLANGFSASGRQVTMVLGNCSGPFHGEVASSVELVDLKRQHVSLALPKLASVLSRKRPDVLLSGLHVANLVALLASEMARPSVPVVVSEHSSLKHILDSRTKLRRSILWGALRTLYPRAARVVTVSHGSAKGLRRLFAAKPLSVEAIPNPIDIGNVRANAGDRETALPDEPLIVAVGRLAPEKRFDDLIRAFAIVRNNVPCRLQILGDGPERRRLEAIGDQLGLSEELSLPGFCKNPFPLIQRASVLVVSSDREGFGNVLVEAMALGTPIVSTNCPHGPSEILEDGRWGYLVPVGDIDALASAIVKTLHLQPVPSADLMRKSEAFDKSHAIKSYLRLLDDVVRVARQSR